MPADNEVAVVTGAARGFGFEIARRLIGRGYTLLITDLDAAAVDDAVARLGPRAHGRAADASDAAAQRATASAAAELRRLTVWVNNAGVARAAQVWEHSDAEVEQMVRSNLLGVMHGSRAAIGAMRAAGGGQILNLASMSSFGPVPGIGVYAATKAGVLGFTTSMQGDLDVAGIPIRVHALCPDAADTTMVRAMQHREDAAILYSGSSLLEPGEVADAAMELLDSRRIVRSLPAWRAATMRAGAVAPTLGLPVMRAMRAYGERRRPR